MENIEKSLLEKLEHYNLGHMGYINHENIERAAAAMTDEEILQLITFADIEFKTAAAIIDDAAQLEQKNTAKLTAMSENLNRRADQIVSASDRLKMVLARPAMPV